MPSYFLRFQTESWNRFAGCASSGVQNTDVSLNFLPTTWSVSPSGTPSSACDQYTPGNVAAAWYVNYSNDTQSASALITGSIASPPNPSVVYDTGVLFVDDGNGNVDPFSPKFDCINGQCKAYTDFNTPGQFASLEACEAVCGFGACASGKICVDAANYCPPGKVCITNSEHQKIQELINRLC